MFNNLSPWVDEEFINRIGYRLDRFRKLKPGLYNCRCPICNDSQKREDLARGYFIQGSGGFRYFCHNCGANLSILRLLKVVDNSIADEYSLEIYKNRFKFSEEPKNKKEITAADIPKARLPEIKKKDQPPGIISALDLPLSHPAYQYLIDREIPISCLSRLYYASKFRLWNDGILKKKHNSNFPDHPRLVIPYYWYDGSIFRYTSRAFGKESPRYQQTVIDPDKPRIFGLERINIDNLVYVVEGQIDSLFLPNAVAVGGANYNVSELNTFPDKIFVPDNQPRNPDVVKQIGSVIASGKKVCLWKENYGKDINAMVLENGLSQDDLVGLIEKSTVQGIEAQLVFSKWRKC